MREAFGGISIFQIVILFILIFTGIMCLTINESKAFSVKDEIITIIQNAPLEDNYELSDATVMQIVNHLKEAGYRTTGKCSTGWKGYSREGDVSNNAAFCIRAKDVTKSFYADSEDKCKNGKCTISGNDDYPKIAYYEVALFYELDIPVIKYFMNFKTYGSTRVLFG